VASRLSENPRFNVLLIEAGPKLVSTTFPEIKHSINIDINRSNEGIIDIAVPAYFQNINSTYSWGHVTTPQIGLNNRSLPYDQARVLGGSSSHSEWQAIISVPPLLVINKADMKS
jgi:choline dehydrogenase